MSPQRQDRQVADNKDRLISRPTHEGLPRRAWTTIAVVFLGALGLASILWWFAPMWAVNDADHTRITASGQEVPDREKIAEAEGAARTPLGVAGAALLAGAAAVAGAIVSSHNARLTRESLEQTRESNRLAALRDSDTKEHSSRVLTHEQARADDDRFTKAIDQLGNTSASVRLGALHSLHRLATQRTERTEVVLDVFCAYLRQPFHHPDHDHEPSEPPSTEDPTGDAWWPRDHKERDERAAEGEVRRTALRLIRELLPPALPSDQRPDSALNDVIPLAPGEQRFNLNLSGAALDHLDLRERQVGVLALEGAYVAGRVVLTQAQVDGALLLGEGTHIRKDLVIGLGARVLQVYMGQGTRVDGTLRISGGSRIERGVDLGPDCYVGAIEIAGAAEVDRLDLGAGVRVAGNITIKDEAQVQRVLRVGRGTRIGGKIGLSHGRLHGNLSVEQDVHIAQGIEIGWDSLVHGAVQIGQNSHLLALDVDAGAIIDGGIILDGAHIENMITLDDGAQVHRGVRLYRRAIVGGHLALRSGARITGMVYLNTSVLRGLTLDEGAHLELLRVDEQGRLELLDVASPTQIGRVEMHRESDTPIDLLTAKGLDVDLWPET